MANLSVKTTFNTHLKLKADTIGKRILAYIIDVGVILLYVKLLDFFLSFFHVDLLDSFGSDASRIAWGWQSLAILPIMFYTLIWEVSTGGYTPGKYATKIKVVKVDGFQPTFVEFFIRWIFRMIDIYCLLIVAISFGNWVAGIFGFYTLGIVGLISMARNKRGQRIGDLVAGTSVIRTNVQHGLDITILKELSEEYKPTYSQVLKLSDNDARIIKETYENAKKNKNEKLIRKLVTKLEDVMGIKNDLPNRQFIDIVLKDFNYYTQDM